VILTLVITDKIVYPETMEEVHMTIQITTTADNRKVLEDIARSLLEERLIACAQILGPIKSIYWWKGDIVEGEEFLCIMKTRLELFEKVKSKIKVLHPYEVPEIVGTNLDALSEDYKTWLQNETKS
jgi:periplasmic divalent cation tolerance protein